MAECEAMPECSHPLRVLVCEDEGLTALRLQRTLTNMGFDVIGEAKDGEEAIRLAAQLKPDVILMDIHMPKATGIEATRRIMEGCATAIVMLTAYSDQELVQSALDAGASGYLVKPVKEEQLKPAITVARASFAQFQELGSEIAGLKETLEARKVVERAKGILMQRRKYTEEEAYKQMQKVSRDRRQTLRDTAQQIIAAAELLG